MKKLLFICIPIVLLCQCEKPSGENKGIENNGYVEVSITVQNEGTRTSLNSNSSHQLEIKWTSGDKLYVVGANDGFLGVITTTGSGSTSANFSGKVLTWSGSQVLHFYYLGNGDKNLDNYAGTVDVDISSQSGTLASISANHQVLHGCTSTEVAAPENGTYTLGAGVSMSSMMGIGLFDLKTSSGFEGGNSKNITLAGAYNAATINLKTGKFSSQAKGNITLTDSATSIFGNYYVALIPDPSNGDTSSVSFIQTGKDTIVFPSNSRIAANFYSNSGAAITVEKPLPLYGDTGLRGIKIGDVIWAPVNCGYDATNYPYGKLYQWGREVACGYNDGSTYQEDLILDYDTSSSVPSSPSSTSFYKFWTASNAASWPTGINPCPKEWQVPTESMFRALITTQNWTNLGGPSGNQPGYLFGTSPSQLFLPAAGFRDWYDGGFYYRGSWAYYWTLNASAKQARDLFFKSTTPPTITTSVRAIGSSVRCVHE